MPEETILTDEQKNKFVGAIADELKTIKDASQAIGTTAVTMRKKLRKDPELLKLYADAVALRSMHYVDEIIDLVNHKSGSLIEFKDKELNVKTLEQQYDRCQVAVASMNIARMALDKAGEELTEGHLRRFMFSIFNAISCNLMSFEVAEKFMSLLEKAAKVIDFIDLSKRVEALEAKLKPKGSKP